MNSYAAIDGVPVAASEELLTSILRERWGFDGVVVSDYFSVAFLHSMHAVAEDLGSAAALALHAGIDVELPTGDAFTAPLAAAVRDGRVDEALVDRAVLRVLAEKEELGLLDETFDQAPTEVDLDTPAHREVARRLAAESIVLLSNDGIAPPRTRRARTSRGDRSERRRAGGADGLLFVRQSCARAPPRGAPWVWRSRALATALRTELSDAVIELAAGCEVAGDDEDRHSGSRRGGTRRLRWPSSSWGIAQGCSDAAPSAKATTSKTSSCRVCSAGSSKEVVGTGVPTVMVVLWVAPTRSGGRSKGPAAPAAVVQAFFPGEEGGAAIAEILTGRTAPSGRLPVSLPRSAGAQPYTYLHPILGGPSEITSADSSPALAFGHGLTYTSFEHTRLTAPAESATDAAFTVTVDVANTGERAGVDVVQLYARDPFASVTRPVAQLVGYARIASRPASEPSSGSRCRRRVSPSPIGAGSASWSRVRSISGWAPRATRRRRGRRCCWAARRTR